MGYAIDGTGLGRRHAAGGGRPLRRRPQGPAPGRTWRSSRVFCRWTARRLQAPAGEPPAWRDLARLLLDASAEGGLTRPTRRPRASRRKRHCGRSRSWDKVQAEIAAARPKYGKRPSAGTEQASRGGLARRLTAELDGVPGSRSWPRRSATPAPWQGAGAVPRGGRVESTRSRHDIIERAIRRRFSARTPSSWSDGGARLWAIVASRWRPRSSTRSSRVAYRRPRAHGLGPDQGPLSSSGCCPRPGRPRASRLPVRAEDVAIRRLLRRSCSAPHVAQLRG